MKSMGLKMFLNKRSRKFAELHSDCIMLHMSQFTVYEILCYTYSHKRKYCLQRQAFQIVRNGKYYEGKQLFHSNTIGIICSQILILLSNLPVVITFCEISFNIVL